METFQPGWLINARQIRGWDTEQLAYAVGRPLWAIEEYERGELCPTMKHMKEIAAAVEFPVGHFFGEFGPGEIKIISWIGHSQLEEEEGDRVLRAEREKDAKGREQEADQRERDRPNTPWHRKRAKEDRQEAARMRASVEGYIEWTKRLPPEPPTFKNPFR